MQFVFATENPGKLSEIREFARRYDCEVISPRQAGLDPVDVDETGTTYEENARLKVQAYLDQPLAKSLVIFGDDTGVEIPALTNEPGIHTRRWLGYRMSDDEIVGYTLGRLHGVSDRSAIFKATIAYSVNGGQIQIATGQTKGMIAERPLLDAPREEGVPFRRIFMVGDPPIPHWRFHQQTIEQRGGVLTHRQAAFKQMLDAIQTELPL